MDIGSVHTATPLLMCSIFMISNKVRVWTRCCWQRDSYGTNQTNNEQRGEGYGSNAWNGQVSCSDLRRALLCRGRETTTTIIFLFDMERTFKSMWLYA